MIPAHVREQIARADREVKNSQFSSFECPLYDPATHFQELTRSGYYFAIILLRQNLKLMADYFFIEK